MRLATLQAEKAATETLMERAERASAEQIKELRDANALATKRLQAAAKERQSILQQKEAACDSWHRASEALAGCQAEKRALETASVGQDKALASARARCAKLESELKEARSRRRPCARSRRRCAAGEAADGRAGGGHEGGEGARQAGSGARRRAGALSAFVESTFMQQQQLVEQQQQQLEQQRRLHDETAHQQFEMAHSRTASERELASAARSAAVAAAAAAARERDALLLSSASRPELADGRTSHARSGDHTSGGGYASGGAADAGAVPGEKSLSEIAHLLDLQSSIRHGAADLHGSLRSKHVSGMLGAENGDPQAAAAASNATMIAPSAAPVPSAPAMAAPLPAACMVGSATSSVASASAPSPREVEWDTARAERMAGWETARAEALRALSISPEEVPMAPSTAPPPPLAPATAGPAPTYSYTYAPPPF